MTFSKKQKTFAATHPEEASPDPAPVESGGEAQEPPADPGSDPASVPPSELDQVKERLLRLQADFDNYRKRMIRERQETVALANSDLLSELLTPLDHMDRAIETMQSNLGEEDACVQGVRLVRTELLSVLGRFGLQALDTRGKTFDPTRHEALGWAKTEGAEDGQIAAEVRAGYLLNGRVLRAAQVMVAGSVPEETDEDAVSSAETEG